MSRNIKNIIIILVGITCLVLIYLFFIKDKTSEEGNLITSTNNTSANVSDNSTNSGDLSTNNMLNLLLGVKGIKLDDSIFSNSAFTNLHDSSIVLSPLNDGQEGRNDPFAPIGHDVAPITNITNQDPVAESINVVVPDDTKKEDLKNSNTKIKENSTINNTLKTTNTTTTNTSKTQ